MNAVARLAAPDPMRAMTTETGCDPRSRSRARNASGSTSTPRTRISTAPTSTRRKRLAQPPFAVVQLLEHFEPAHVLGQPIAGQVGDIGVELPQPVPGGVVPHQTCAHHRAVGIDDPPAGRRHRAVVGFGVGDLPSPASSIVARRVTPVPRKPRRPQACLAHAAANDVTSISPRKPSRDTSSKSIPGAHFTTRSRLAVYIQQCIQSRCVVARIEPAPSAAAPGGVDEDDGVTGDRPQRVGATQVDVGDIVPRPSPAGPGRCRCRRRRQPNSAVPQAQCRSNRSRRAPRRRPTAVPVRGHRFGGGLLQRLVGEQPLRRVGEFGCRPSAQQRRLHQTRRHDHRNGHAPRRCRQPVWRPSAGSPLTSRKCRAPASDRR